MASIQKKVLPDGTIKARVFFWTDNIRASRTLYAKNEAILAAQVAVYESRLKETGDLDGRTFAEKNGVLVPEFMDKYILYLTSRRSPIEAKTKDKYLNINRNIISPYFKNRKLTSLTVKDVQDFLVFIGTPAAKKNKSNKKPYSDATQKDIYTLLKGALSMARHWKYITENPCDNLVAGDLPSCKALSADEKKAKFYDGDELVTLLNTIDRETKTALDIIELEKNGNKQPFTLQKEKVSKLSYQLVIYIAVFTGMRVGEIVALKRDAISFETRMIHVACHNAYTPEEKIYERANTKNKEDRYVAFSDTLYQMIACYLHELDLLFDLANGEIPRTDSLFFAIKNTKNCKAGGLKAPDPVSEWFKEFLIRNNLKRITFHNLRASSLSFLKNVSSNEEVFSNDCIAKVAGHKSENTFTKYYERTWDEKLIAAAEQFEEFNKKRLTSGTSQEK